MAFDLSSVLSGVSNPDTEFKQIEYIPIDRIDPDPDNFYSLDGLNELAGNIELIGLQQPLVVRPGKSDRVTVVSGHRRRAAIMLIRDGGSDMFDKGVPCIREVGECSKALQELRLIYANSSTRVLSSAETSKQAERVEALLYELQQQGVEFPGRMRDHVAQACKVSKSKIARLHAIRKNLFTALLRAFDAGNLSESAAYELQKLPEDVQQAIAEAADGKKGFKTIRGDCAAKAVEKQEEYLKELTCSDDKSKCSHVAPRFVRTALDPYGPYNSCKGGCCMQCYYRRECKYSCDKTKKALKQERADAEKAKADEKDRQTQTQLKRRKIAQKEAAIYLPLVEAANVTENKTLPGLYNVTLAKIRRYAAGEFDNNDFFSESFMVPYSCVDLKKLAKLLNVSADFILGLSPYPERASAVDAAAWYTGLPDETGEYFVKFDCQGTELKRVAWFDRVSKDFYFKMRGQKIDAVCVAWYPLPED